VAGTKGALGSRRHPPDRGAVRIAPYSGPTLAQPPMPEDSATHLRSLVAPPNPRYFGQDPPPWRGCPRWTRSPPTSARRCPPPPCFVLPGGASRSFDGLIRAVPGTLGHGFRLSSTIRLDICSASATTLASGGEIRVGTITGVRGSTDQFLAHPAEGQVPQKHWFASGTPAYQPWRDIV